MASLPRFSPKVVTVRYEEQPCHPLAKRAALMPAGGVAAQDFPFDPTYGPAITVNGRWPMVNGQWSMVNGQW